MPATTDACIRALIPGVHSAPSERRRGGCSISRPVGVVVRYVCLVVARGLQPAVSTAGDQGLRAESLRRCRTSCQHRQYFSLEKKVEPFSEAPFGLPFIGPPDVVSPMCQPVTAEKLSRL